MTSMQIIVLAVVQGLTEFLPVSSSGHLVLVPKFLGWQDQGIIFDISVHLGSLAAVCIYFRGDLIELLKGAPDLLFFRPRGKSSNLLFLLILSTIPAALIGFISSDWIESIFEEPTHNSCNFSFLWGADVGCR